MTSRNNGRARLGFTLLELSVVLVLIAIILGMGLVTLNASLQATQYNVTVARMDAIEKTLLNFAAAFNRIPCPADLTLTSASGNYGLEAGASAGGTAKGECVTGMTPGANFKSTSGAEEGGLPTRALQLPDDYMYDGWGRKFRYAVDPTMTKANVLPFPAGGLCSASASGITVSNASGAARTTAAIYALISHGANGHGAYTSNGVTVNAASVNADELTNCHCNSSAASTTYTPTYVEKVPMQDATNALNNFDDIVTFKEGWQMQAVNYPLAAKLQCTVIYVVDAGNSRVQKFDASGNYLGQFGSLGSGNGQFDYPFDITIDASGNLYVSDSINNRVQKFDSNGNYLSQFGSGGSGNGQLSNPEGLAIDASGNIYVVDDYNMRVEKFDSNGNCLSQFGSGGTGNGQFSYPVGIAIDSTGNLYVTEYANNRVQKFNASGTYLAQFGGAQVANPTAITIDGANHVWVTGSGSYAVWEFDTSGTYLGQFGAWGSGNGQFIGSWGLAVDGSNNVWLTDWSNSRVQEFSSSGTYMSQFGAPGTGNGQFMSTAWNPIRGIAISGR